MSSSIQSDYDSKFLKKLMKTDTGDVRLIWIFVIMPVYFLSAIIFSRVIFILIAI
ncbi:MAG: hypothetical protein ACW99A_12680 [Candidatus Kariarchaeaceae archaeon]|jgi:hypothetical protein